PLEQSRPLARRAAPAPQVRLGVLPQLAEVLLVFLPREVALVSITQECNPLFARAQLGVIFAVDPLARAAASIGEGACVARVVEEMKRLRMVERSPDQLALVWALAEPPRKRNLLLAEGAHRLEGGAGATEGLEEEMQRSLHLLVRVPHYRAVRRVDQPHGKAATELPPPRLAEYPTQKAGAQHVQLRLAHGALEAQQQAIVEVARVVDAILIEDQGVTEGADLQEPMPIRGAPGETRDL